MYIWKWDISVCAHLLHCLIFSFFHFRHSSVSGGIVPYDGVPTEEEVSVDLSLTVIFSILATAGIAFAVICLAVNFIFRNKK